MNLKDWSDALRLIGYIEGINDAIGDPEGHDEIQGAINAIVDILWKYSPPEEMK